ncbi:AsnC family protein [Mesorhizobium sp. M0563]|uniref:Lrp/AsnC family transcriptional regulator n=1 Tax=Mesorhizobium sp. M0563 TaxID=2956959 RepID=UPI00333AFE54
MDDLARRILTALQKNNRLSFAELAELAGSSAASCMRRVNKLAFGWCDPCGHLAGGCEGFW